MIPLQFEPRFDADMTPRIEPGTVRVLRAPSLTVEDQLAWSHLSKIACADSIFSASWFMQSVLANFDVEHNYRLFVVQGDDGDWDGVFIAARVTQLGRIPLAHLKNMLDANQFLGVPLVRPGAEYRFWVKLCDALDTAKLGCTAIRFSEMPADHRVTQSLLAYCQDSGRGIEMLASKERALWTPDGSSDFNWSDNLSAKQARRFASLERQFTEQLGLIELHTVNNSAELDRWISEFLALELAGWKGREGSALSSNSATAVHFRFVVKTGFEAGKLRALALRANDQPVAMSSYFLDGQHAFGFKAAYDESFAKFAPGMLLKKAIMELHQATLGLCFDSCSDPDAHAINKLWPNRRPIHDYLVSIGNVFDRGQFKAAIAARGLWHRLKALKPPSPF